MTEYIDKKEAMRRLKAAYDGSVAVHGDKDNLFADGIDYAMDIVRNIKAADVPPVIHAKWELRHAENGSGEIKAYCTNCGKPNKQYRPPYCPHCGSKMLV